MDRPPGTAKEGRDSVARGLSLSTGADTNHLTKLIGADAAITLSPPQDSWSEQRLYRPFIIWSLIVALTLGFTAGAGMLMLPALGIDRDLWWLKHAQFHGQAQIFGFAGLFTMGVAFHVVPRFRRAVPPFPIPQQATLALIVTAVFLRSFGQALSQRPVGPYMLYASGAALLLGTLVFAGFIAVTLKRGDSSRTPVELWIASGAFWAVAAAAIHFRAMIEMGVEGTPLVNGAWEWALIYAGIFGFIVNFIFAISTRVIVGFMNLRPGFRVFRWAALALVNVGVAVYVAGRLVSWDQNVIGLGTIFLAVGLVSFVISIRIFEGPTKRRPYILPAYARYEWFVKAAYGWLVVSAVLLFVQGLEGVLGERVLPSLSTAPVIHVFTLGFITMMIFGLSARMLPLFEPTTLPYRRAIDAAFVLLNVSVGLRLVFGLGSPAGADAFLALSGTAGLAALISYSVPLFKSMRPAARAKYAEMMAELGAERLHQIQVYRASKLPEQ